MLWPSCREEPNDSPSKRGVGCEQASDQSCEDKEEGIGFEAGESDGLGEGLEEAVHRDLPPQTDVPCWRKNRQIAKYETWG